MGSVLNKLKKLLGIVTINMSLMFTAVCVQPVYAAEEWLPVISEVVGDSTCSMALAGDTVTLIAQLRDRNNNKVSNSGESVTFSYEDGSGRRQTISEGYTIGSVSGKGATVVSVDKFSNYLGQAKLVLKSEDAGTIVNAIRAETRLYKTGLDMDDETVEKVDLYWVDTLDYDAADSDVKPVKTAKSEKIAEKNAFQVSAKAEVGFYKFELKEPMDVVVNVKCTSGNATRNRFLLVLSEDEEFSLLGDDEVIYAGDNVEYCWEFLEKGVYYVCFRNMASGNQNATYNISLVERDNKIKVESISLNKKSAILWLNNNAGKMSVNLKAKVKPSDATNQQVQWRSSNEKVAKVSSAGKVISVAPGEAVIQAVALDGSKKKASCKITVKPSAAKIKGKNSMGLGERQTITTDTLGGSWVCSDKDRIEFISATKKKAVIKALVPGKVTLYYVVGGIKSNKITINITAPKPVIKGKTSVSQGSTISFTTSVEGGKWVSSDASVLKVISTNSKGAVFKGISEGSAVVSYIANGVTSNSVRVMVKKVETTPTTPPQEETIIPSISGGDSVKVGDTISFAVSNNMLNGKWYSSDTSVLSVQASADGDICVGTGLKAGVVNVYYIVNGVKSNVIQVVVKGI